MSETGGGLLAIMGSGELAKSMLPVHRKLIARAGSPVKAIFLDTPAAFQSNVEDLARQAAAFYERSLRITLGTPPWTDYTDPARRGSYLNRIEDSTLVFSGPGSPSYALRQWIGTPIPDLLLDKLASDGCVAFASAAAITLGAVAIPVYEIFKSGEDPYWLPGLGILPRLGLDVAVVPHFDNGAGQGYDTRFCFVGERRFGELVARLPPGTGILGVDEHTACLVDLTARRASAHGRGRVIFDTGRSTAELRSGESIDLDRIGTGAPAPPPAPTRPAAPLRVEPEEAGGGRLQELVDSLVALRSQARAGYDWKLADALRRALEDSGIRLQDTPEGTTWSWAEER